MDLRVGCGARVTALVDSILNPPRDNVLRTAYLALTKWALKARNARDGWHLEIPSVQLITPNLPDAANYEAEAGMVERNAGLPPERRIEFRVGIHLGDVVEESDGDLMGDGVNLAAGLDGIARLGAICLSENAYRQVKSRLDLAVSDLGATQLKNIAEPVRVYSVEVGKPASSKPIKAAQRNLLPIIAAIVP